MPAHRLTLWKDRASKFTLRLEFKKQLRLISKTEFATYLKVCPGGRHARLNIQHALR